MIIGPATLAQFPALAVIMASAPGALLNDLITMRSWGRC